MKKSEKVIYYITTGLFSALILMSAMSYLFAHEQSAGNFEAMGFPSFILYPLALAKILGLVAIWSRKSKTLLEWAYAGFFFNLLLAVGGHINAGDGMAALPVVFIGLVMTSYFLGKKKD